MTNFIEVGLLEVGDRVEARCFDDVIRPGVVTAKRYHGYGADAPVVAVQITFPECVRADGWFSGQAVRSLLTRKNGCARCASIAAGITTPPPLSPFTVEAD